jgi:hypothetical protein
MSRFRLFLAWLIVAAIPLQGLAASSMLFCGMGGHHAPAQFTAAQAGMDSRADTASVEHDHSKHSHAGDGQTKKTDNAGKAGKKLPDTAHKCAVCASCCNIVAITEFPQLVAFAPVPQAELAEPFVLIHARPSQVPDKPPRA